MKKDGITLVSRGKEEVWGLLHGKSVRRTVYQLPDQWVFYVKEGSGDDVVWTQVYHMPNYFSTTPQTAEKIYDITKDQEVPFMVWIDGETGWYRVFVINGEFYIRYGVNCFDKLSNHHIDKIELW